MFFILENEERISAAQEFLAALPLTSPPYCLEIKPYKRIRSAAQNRLYWGIVNVISDHVGYTPDELHDVLKIKFIGIEKKQYFDQEFIIPKSTRELSTKEFTEFIQKVINLATSMNIVIPYSDERDYALYGTKNSKT